MLDMNLVSLIDVFTILIFFLLSGASGVEMLPSPKAVKLPQSMAETSPRETVVVIVSAAEILVDGRSVAKVVRGAGGQGRPDRRPEARARPAGRRAWWCARRTRRRARR